MKRLLTKCALLLALCAALALPALADSVTDTISVCIGYFGWTEDEYVEKAKFSWQELDDWYGGALDTHEEFYSYSNGGGRTYLVYAHGFYIRDLLDYAGVDVNSIASIDFFTKDHSNGAYRSFTKYALLDQPRYYFPNLAADPETGELYAWDGGDDLWVGAYQVEPMLALEDYTEWDTSGFDFESYVDESLFSTGNRFHLFFGQQSPEEAATSSAAKYVYKILVTFSGTPVLSSEEQNLDLIVGSDHALHVTADAEDDALTDYVQQNLQYVSSDPSVVSVDQYGRLHVNAEGDAVITASFGQSSVSVNVHVGSGGASGTGSTSGTGTEPGGEAASGTLDLPKPEEAEAVPVTEPVDARSVYILSGGAVSTGENGTTAGEGMQDGSVQLVLPEKAAQKTWPVYAALALSVLPFEARAASDAWDGTVDISWYDPAKTEYEIDTPAKLAGLAALVNGMADPTAKKIVGNTAYLVSKKVDNVMLVGVSGERSEAEFETGWQPAVRNLVLGSGWIYARRMVGGIVGRVGETSNGVVIENCGNRADIKNTDSKGVGGIVGSAWGKGTIHSCYNTGSASTTYTCPAGGILGSNEGMDVYNCYSAGKNDTNGAQYGRGIGGHDTGSYTVAGCWYLSGSDDDPASNGYYMGTSRRITVDVTAADQKTLQSEAVLTALNTNGAVFAQDAAGKNDGYPILWFENGQKGTDCQLTQASAANGAFTVSQTGAVRFGTSVSLAAQPAAGYRLAYFTANGSQILGDYYTVTGDTELAAVFQKVKTASVTVPEYGAFYLAAARTGYQLTADGMEYVEREALHTGDTVLEGNILTLQTHSYADAIPADGALEYREGYQFSVSGAEKNADGTYTVTGSGPVVLRA